MSKTWEIEELVADACQFAAQQHGTQARKGTAIPYIVHPLNVAKYLIRYGAETDLAIAGVLHDVVEDTPATVDDVRERYGDRVAELVEHASEPDKNADWRTRKEHTVNAARVCQDLEMLALKCADKLDNLKDIRFDYGHEGDALWERFNTPLGKSDQQWYYSALCEVFTAKLTGTQWQGLADELTCELNAIFGH